MITSLANTSSDTAAESATTYRFDSAGIERRRSMRHVISGRVTALVKTDPLDAAQRICSLELLNISDTGLGTISEKPVEPGSRISVFCPPHGFERGYDLLGTVVRCQRFESGYEVGIELFAKAAA